MRVKIGERDKGRDERVEACGTFGDFSWNPCSALASWGALGVWARKSPPLCRTILILVSSSACYGGTSGVLPSFIRASYVH